MQGKRGEWSPATGEEEERIPLRKREKRKHRFGEPLIVSSTWRERRALSRKIGGEKATEKRKNRVVSLLSLCQEGSQF